MPHPDQDWAPNASAVCSDDGSEVTSKLWAVDVGDDLRKVGVIKCMFSDSLGDPLGAGVKLAGEAAFTYFYFLSSSNGQPTLFMVETKNPSSMFDALVPILEKAYGKAIHSTAAVTTSTGTSVTNDIFTWENTHSRIEFRRYGDSLAQYSLHHILVPVMNEFDRRIDAMRAEKAKDL